MIAADGGGANATSTEVLVPKDVVHRGARWYSVGTVSIHKEFAMAGGYVGKILHVDLTERTHRVEQPDEVFYRRYVGGGLMGVYYLLTQTRPGLDPYEPDSPLVVMTSAMSGTAFDGANRYSVVAKNPLTGGYGESEAGGFWGPRLKMAGFDGLVITGRAPEPTWLAIADGQVELRDAAPYWGRLSGEVQDGIEQELGREGLAVLQTGIAGENRVRFASLVNQLRHFHGRCGLGGVMASKNLRAIAVKGRQRPQAADPEAAQRVAHELKQAYDRTKDPMHVQGTPRLVRALQKRGILPTRNFRDGSFDAFEGLTAERMIETILVRRSACYACAVACKRNVASPGCGVVPKYGGPEYETIAALGSMCGVGDLEKVSLGNQLCNQYVMDTISTGVTIAFAMECWGKGLLTAADTGGLELTYGDGDVMVRLIELIARREGIGDLLAEGVARAADRLGPEAQPLAMHVKGQETPLHDPRGKQGMTLSYATSPTGADHIEAVHDVFFANIGPADHPMAPLGLIEPVDFFDLGPRKVRAFAYGQKVFGLYNVIGMCNFAGAPIGHIPLSRLVAYMQAVTGWDVSLWELLRASDRSSTLYRVYNLREGIGADKDTLPPRLFEPLENGPIRGRRIDRDEFERARALYYELSGWDPATGVPRPATFVDLDIQWAAEHLPSGPSGA